MPTSRERQLEELVDFYRFNAIPHMETIMTQYRDSREEAERRLEEYKNMCHQIGVRRCF